MLKFERVKGMKGGLSLSVYKKEARFNRPFCNAFLLVLGLHLGAFCLFSVSRHPHSGEFTVFVPAKVEIDLGGESTHSNEEEGGSLPHPLARQLPTTPLPLREPLEKRELSLELAPLTPFGSLSFLDQFSELPEPLPLELGNPLSSPLSLNFSGNLSNYNLKRTPSVSLPAGCPSFSLLYQAKLDCKSGRLFSCSLIKSEDNASLPKTLFPTIEKWLESLQFEPSSSEFIAEGTLEVHYD